jgi:hypothetical protein
VFQLFGMRKTRVRYGVAQCDADEETLRARLNWISDKGARLVSVVPARGEKIFLIWEYEDNAERPQGRKEPLST